MQAIIVFKGRSPSGSEDQIGKKSGIPDIVGLLSERLSGTELNSLLLEVFGSGWGG